MTKRYEQYRDSGVAWLGEIPAHWEISKLGDCLKPVSIKNKPELSLLSITREKGVILRDVDDQEENHNFIPDDLSNYKLLEKGQFGMNKMKAWQGSYGVSGHTGIVSPAYYVFAFSKEINPDFFHVAIRSVLYVSFFGSASDGVRIGQWDLSKSRMKEIPFLIPPKEEQTAIAAFLDEKTAQIEEAIALKERQIALLKERKQILIQTAVTRGLNPHAPLRDSGIDWIGPIPVHWKMKKITHIFNTIGSGTTPTSGDRRFYDGNIHWLQTGDLNDGEICQTSKKITPFALTRFSSLKVYPANSLVMAMYGATIGKLGLLKIPSATNQACCVMSNPTKEAKTKYMFLLLLSFRSKVVSMGYGGGQPNISQEIIRSLRLPLPSKEEQTAIVAHIETESTKIDEVIALQEQLIEKLKEYKTTLINSAVTGKIKVA